MSSCAVTRTKVLCINSPLSQTTLFLHENNTYRRKEKYLIYAVVWTLILIKRRNTLQFGVRNCHISHFFEFLSCILSGHISHFDFTHISHTVPFTRFSFCTLDVNDFTNKCTKLYFRPLIGRYRKIGKFIKTCVMIVYFRIAATFYIILVFLFFEYHWTECFPKN